MKKIIILFILIHFFSLFAQAFEVLSIQPFNLEAPKIHFWEKEKPLYSKGSLIIAKVNAKDFGISQSQNNQVLIDGRVLERLDSGENRSILAFFLPEQIHSRSVDLLVKKTIELPEQISKTQRQEMVEKARISRQLTQISISSTSEQNLKNERELYSWAGRELLKWDPSAETSIQHWLTKTSK